MSTFDEHAEVSPEPEGSGDEAALEAELSEIPDDVSSLLDDDPLVAMTKERDDYLGALQRLQADFENFKKRVQRTHHDEVARAAGDLVAKLLVVVDTLDLAQAHLADAEDAQAEAAALVAARAQLLEVLTKEGLERVAEVGAAFDPTFHDAVAHAAAEDGDGTTVVDEVLRAGYVWRGQVLRPAMVRVKS